MAALNDQIPIWKMPASAERGCAVERIVQKAGARILGGGDPALLARCLLVSFDARVPGLWVPEILG